MPAHHPPAAAPSSSDVEEARALFHAVLGSGVTRDGDSEGMGARTLQELGWHRWTRAWSLRCETHDAQELVRTLGVLPTDEGARRRREEILELMALAMSSDRMVLRGVRPLVAVLHRLRREQVLRGDELWAVAESLQATDQVRAWLRVQTGRLPRVALQLQRLVALPDFGAELRRCLEPTGLLRDEASPELARLRRRALALRDQIRDRLDRILRSPRFEGILQDDWFTLREDRFVVPVRAGERGDFPGIVHGASGSGATLFIEPQDIVSLNHEFRLNQHAIEQEEHRLLALLSARAARHVDVLDDNQDLLVWLDLSQALAALCVDLDCQAPVLTTPEEVDALVLHRARHPLLALRERDGELTVVPNDVVMPAGATALIISGPNTGGKTVTLRMIGLFAVMARAGCPVPCGPGSRLPLFRSIMADIGDEQSVERDLSTFSAHLQHIVRVLPDCDRGSLVLLDELFAGTDPEQGAALARALLDELVSRGSWVVVTTHLDRLKTLAFEDGRYAAASVGFDVDRLEPTWSLRMGVPGSSYAIRIASRLGLPRRIVDAAASLLQEGASHQREALLDAIEREHALLQQERSQMQHERAELARRQQDAEARRQEALRRDRDLLREEDRLLRQQLNALRQKARTWEESLRTTADVTPRGSLPEVGEVRRAVEAMQTAHRQLAVPEATPAAPTDASGRPVATIEDLHAGVRVWVPAFSKEGTVLEDARPGQRVPVQVGAMRASFLPAELRLVPAAQGRDEPAVQVVRTPMPSDASQVLDLRGAQVEDAMERLDVFLDRAIRARFHRILVIHGHGTGALKRAVRGQLARSPWELHYQPADRSEGGDGVTVVYLEGPAPPPEAP
jgi:DNA mismatch repair protein MutS2